ncbi:MAG: nucleoside triphosphate pyrophosphohydrolase [Chloroflexi bacterium]|jgi:tetrapyrrole methylase family protein/MazG family protein|nr:nucleoside triphosphate pyrophosphohydrolase [Chloroflexota bacterium]MDP6420761.1 nucleoside triphosphate pyrophosphohydrolase [SAR202 cluster bacterium]HAL49008.1 nucleoside triphosphate pyrophosphohydrolase [Dehalococcoidia bacterium]MDP6663095.1 nucleoside triphosphate pyrophosphohydrolase [SAR202 cluster bacterium]MDP6800390.1 nucleoside triphosphate pyrophosphohydrolase [SAR202 cluster bacterium]|tara:strand:- start:2670 stop:3458 length:789 start_codon:yes stop_codon:yes gene_type:complete
MPESTSFPATYEGVRLLVKHLRGPDGCPWDREQTPESLKHLLLEECYELIEAIEDDDSDKIVEELGDVFLHLALQIQIGTEAGRFSGERVFGGMVDKYVRRHPHVFGDAKMEDVSEAVPRWDALKRQELEGSTKSILDGLPKGMPALSYARAVQDRAARMGFDWEDYRGVVDKVAEELRELNDAESPEERESEMGDLLFSVVNASRWLGAEAETALRLSNRRFYNRFTTMERLCRERDQSFKDLPLDSKEQLWEEAKAIEKG